MSAQQAPCSRSSAKGVWHLNFVVVLPWMIDNNSSNSWQAMSQPFDPLPASEKLPQLGGLSAMQNMMPCALQLCLLPCQLSDHQDKGDVSEAQTPAQDDKRTT